MSFTNGHVLSDLRDIGSTPAASNAEYIFDVQNWSWFQLWELGIWNGDPKCHCLDDWVDDFSFKFKESAKKYWKGSYKSFLTAHKIWLAKTIEFPEAVVDCLCAEYEDENENENEVGSKLQFFRMLSCYFYSLPKQFI